MSIPCISSTIKRPLLCWLLQAYACDENRRIGPPLLQSPNALRLLQTAAALQVTMWCLFPSSVLGTNVYRIPIFLLLAFIVFERSLGSKPLRKTYYSRSTWFLAPGERFSELQSPSPPPVSWWRPLPHLIPAQLSYKPWSLCLVIPLVSFRQISIYPSPYAIPSRISLLSHTGGIMVLHPLLSCPIPSSVFSLGHGSLSSVDTSNLPFSFTIFDIEVSLSWK